MHITLTDRLTCPRCGPGAGLIVLMDEVAERRVISGSLGCPVCKARYAIAGRVADLRLAGGRGAAGSAGNDRAGAGAGARPGARAGDGAMRLAGLLGLNDGGGFVVIDGPDALAAASGLRELTPEYEAVVVVDEEEVAAAGQEAVSALMTDAGLPMADSLMRGAAYVGGVPTAERLAELVRVVRPTGRVVVDGVPTAALDGAVRMLESLGAQVRARDEGGVVAVVM